MNLKFEKSDHPMSTSWNGFTVRSARATDYAFWKKILRSSRLQFGGMLMGGSAFVITLNGEHAGLMYHTVLWGSMPMLNMVFVRKSLRGKGVGTFAVTRWEALMRKRGYRGVLVCVPSDMVHQNFYRALGYRDCGSLNIDIAGKSTPADLFLVKYFN